jgi:hypothetical protein
MLLASLILLAAQEPREMAEMATARAEQRMSDWKPGKDDRITPPSAMWAKDAEVSGGWQTDGRLDRTILVLRKTGRGKYKVDFETWGCLSRWTLVRTAELRDGTLFLNKPVEEYASWTYDRLYTVRLGNTVRLISPALVAYLSKDKSLGDTSTMRLFSLHRLDKPLK